MDSGRIQYVNERLFPEAAVTACIVSIFEKCKGFRTLMIKSVLLKREPRGRQLAKNNMDKFQADINSWL